VRAIVLLVFLIVACRPDPPPLNPYKGKGRQGPSEVENAPVEAPAANVVKRDGTLIDLASLWQKQKVVVVFYRGGWCPHCQKQLGELQSNQKQFADAGAIILGISSDSVEDANKTRDKLGLNFELYSDPQLQVISQWGVEDVGSNIARTAVASASTVAQRNSSIVAATSRSRSERSPLISPAKWLQASTRPITSAASGGRLPRRRSHSVPGSATGAAGGGGVGASSIAVSRAGGAAPTAGSGAGSEHALTASASNRTALARKWLFKA